MNYFDTTEQAVIESLIAAPDCKLTLAELQAKTNLPVPTLKRYLEVLEHDTLVTRHKGVFTLVPGMRPASAIFALDPDLDPDMSRISNLFELSPGMRFHYGHGYAVNSSGMEEGI